MNENTPLPEQDLVNKMSIPSDKVTVIDINELKSNSVLVIKVDVENQSQKEEIFPLFAKFHKPYTEQLRQKKISVMLMMATETFEVVPETVMNQMGWFKKEKEKSLIINPFGEK